MKINKRSGPERMGLTSGRAAEYCFVSTGTIQNWARKGRLQSQRTAGGQFRIRADHLRDFMIENGMSVEALERDCGLSFQSFCWEFFSCVRSHTESAACRKCIVQKTKALNCFELRKHVDHKQVHCKSSCEECDYWRSRNHDGE